MTASRQAADRRRIPGRAGTHFRVWAPAARRVDVVFERDCLPRRWPRSRAATSPGSWPEAGRARAIAFARRRRRIPRSRLALPARGAARPFRGGRPLDGFDWTDGDWRGVDRARAGALRDARRHVHARGHLGRRRGAPALPDGRRHHGDRDDAGRRVPRPVRLGLRRRRPVRARRTSTARPTTCARFVDRAHALGHRRDPRRRLQPLRPGRQLPRRSSRRDYFTDRYENEWGEAINFDGENAAPVREFFVANAGYWIDEYHLDGLRLDATQDDLRRLARAHPRRRSRGARARRPRARDDLHRRRERAAGRRRWCARRARAATASTRCGTTTSTTARCVALTGRNEAYYTDYRGTPQELVSARQVRLPLPGPVLRVAEAARAARRRSTCRRARSSTSSRTTTRSPTRRAAQRLHELTSPGALPRADRAAAARAGDADAVPGPGVRAVAPVPLLRRPRRRSWRELVRKGRREFLSQFPQPGDARDAGARCPIPADRATFERCKLDLARARAARARCTRCTATCCGCAARTRCFARSGRGGVDGAVLGAEAFVLRFFGDDGDDRLLLVNLGRDLDARRRCPSRCWRRPPGTRWQRALVERGPALRRQRHAAARRRATAGACPAHAAVLCCARAATGERRR